MRFYKQPHAFYAGIDLHARSMFTHILNHEGATVFERDLPANPGADIDDYRACETKPTLTILTRKKIPRCHREENVAHPSGAR